MGEEVSGRLWLKVGGDLCVVAGIGLLTYEVSGLRTVYWYAGNDTRLWLALGAALLATGIIARRW